jgi:hypothetical protein
MTPPLRAKGTLCMALPLPVPAGAAQPGALRIAARSLISASRGIRLGCGEFFGTRGGSTA